ncbi:MAG: flagellar hook-basal body protein [Planctomycetes bacterium]|nr:flagellar hook-basal body protein [Planctomycetota bacterium]
MLYGLYLSAQGAAAQHARLDVVGNNLANASTGAFKRDLAVLAAHPPAEANRHGPPLPGELQNVTGGVLFDATATDFSPGALDETGGTWDLALAGPGFFRVGDGRQEFLTRDGRLAVNDRGEVVTADGRFNVLAGGGRPLVVPADATNAEVAHDGTVSATLPGGQRVLVGRLDLVEPRPGGPLTKIGHGLYHAPGPLVAAEGAGVRQGFVEASNVRPVAEMMQMIEATRALETNVNMIRFQDEALGRLLAATARR